MSKRKNFVVPPNVDLKNRPFSNAVLCGDTLYISGHIAHAVVTGKSSLTPADEARMVLEDFQSTLRAAGFSMDELVFVQVFCSDVSLFSIWNSVYVTFFTGDYPARAFLGSGTLLFNASFEIQGIAVKIDSK